MNVIGEVAIQKTEAQVKANLRQRHRTQQAAFGVLWLTGGFVVVVLFFVIFYLLIQSGKFFIGTENLLEDVVLKDTSIEIQEAVANTPYAIGYVSFNTLDDTTKVVSLNGVAPTVDNVLQDRYPVMHTLYMLTDNSMHAEVAAWLDYIQSQEGQAVIAEAGYVPLKDAPEFVPAADGYAGEVTLEGSSEAWEVGERLAKTFSAKYAPDLTFSYEEVSASSAIKHAGRGEVAVGLSSRDIKGVEFRRYDALQAYPIAQEGIAVVLHPDLPVDNLTINQVRDIYTGFIDNWEDVGGPNAPITVISRDTSSGTWNGFENWVVRKDLLISKGFKTENIRMMTQGIWASIKFIWRFLISEPLPGMGGKGGISTTILTTLYMVVLTLAIATPLGVGSAIYLVEYAGEMGGQSKGMRQVVEVIRFAVETLAGVPSIIYGLFGFALFVTVLHLGLSMISGALAGACLILPVIIRTTEEALLTVPRSYREGSLALGATKWQTNWQVVLPAAMPGIVTGVILGVGRIVSETAVFYVTLGGSINLPESPMDQGRTMVLHLYSLLMDANAPDPAMGTAMVLIVTIILINLGINYFSNRLSRSMSGKA